MSNNSKTGKDSIKKEAESRMYLELITISTIRWQLTTPLAPETATSKQTKVILSYNNENFLI